MLRGGREGSLSRLKLRFLGGILLIVALLLVRKLDLGVPGCDKEGLIPVPGLEEEGRICSKSSLLWLLLKDLILCRLLDLGGNSRFSVENLLLPFLFLGEERGLAFVIFIL